MIIGIIGKVGAGKSCAIKYIVENYSAISFSCDEVSKTIINEEKNNMNFDEQVYTNENLQEQIRTVFHPKVFDRIFENINEFSRNIKNANNFSEQIFLIETALPSGDFMKKCDKVICINNSYEKKVKILKEHRNYSEEKIKTILKSQEYYTKYYNDADYIIHNDSTKEAFLSRVKEVMDEICVICK